MFLGLVLKLFFNNRQKSQQNISSKLKWCSKTFWILKVSFSVITYTSFQFGSIFFQQISFQTSVLWFDLFGYSITTFQKTHRTYLVVDSAERLLRTNLRSWGHHVGFKIWGREAIMSVLTFKLVTFWLLFEVGTLGRQQHTLDRYDYYFLRFGRNPPLWRLLRPQCGI